MTLKYLVGGLIRGQSNDIKPTTVPQGTKFEEINTGSLYIFDGSKWKYWMDSKEGKLYREQQNNLQGSPLLRLTGDEFAQNAESALYLLDDLNSEIGGGVLTNNNAATFVEESELPLRGFNVLNLVAASSQYLSRATEAQFEVGTGSFITSIWMKGTTTSGFLFQYGDQAASEQNWFCNIDSSGLVNATIDDGTNTVQISDTVANRVLDNRWHCIIVFVDRTANIMYLIIDGQIVASASIASVTLTLNNAGTNFLIGAATNTTVQAYFTGQLANFHLIKSADYNAIAVLNQGIRERVNVGSSVTLAANSANRLNNQIGTTSSQNDYTTTVIDVEDGEYEIQYVYLKNTNEGISKIQIDGNTVMTTDQYDGSLTRNNVNKVYGVKLSGGKHILKILTDDKNASSSAYLSVFQFINLIKRKGHENGGCTEFLLLGDEIMQRENAAWSSSLVVATADFYNNRITENTNGDYTEGEIFIKGGLWKIEVYVREDTTNAGKIDLDFGSVEVLDSLVTSASTNLVTTVKNVRLNQGKNNIRLAVVTGTGTPTVRIAAIRGVRVSD